MKTFNQIDGTNYLFLYLLDNDTYFTHGEYKQKKLYLMKQITSNYQKNISDIFK